MNKCTVCGRNLYNIKKEMVGYGTPLHAKFSEPPKPAEEFFNKYGLSICCRIQLLTYIPDKELSHMY